MALRVNVERKAVMPRVFQREDRVNANQNQNQKQIKTKKQQMKGNLRSASSRDWKRSLSFWGTGNRRKLTRAHEALSIV